MYHFSDSLTQAIEESNSFIFGKNEKWEANTEIPMHHHSRHQLIYSTKGTIKVLTDQGFWILPLSRLSGLIKTLPMVFVQNFQQKYIFYISKKK
ncbi:hypothetical protein PYR76_18480 (plasmid) [Acinetobacter soli]|nr:hypothetical protein [Acinetobacter soli]WEH90962.1 hypothetical protein PYR75_00200 [Acinetobacter soli]WEH99309.1 hypothetical protein PYR76_18480 [Acinetobacter soli]